MITQIDISNTATFGATHQILDELRKINFIFGVNGTGKTTISKIIAEPLQFPNCAVTWKNGLELNKLVYNRDFVERNFKGSFKGIFTLGEQQINVLGEIENTKNEIDKLNNDIKTLLVTLQGEDNNGGKTKELLELETTYNDRFWSAKQKHDANLSGALKGVMGKKEKFKEKVLSEALNNQAELKPIDDIEARAAKIFSDVSPVEMQMITTIDTEKLFSLEYLPILKKRIIGKDDVDIATMIKKLDNSDWVRQGVSYYSINDGRCPFCQQETEKHFADSLREYFDETFEKDNVAIGNLILDYTAETDRIQQEIQAIIELNSEFIDNTKLENEKKLLDSTIAANIQKLAIKKKETSQIIELDSLRNILNTIIEIITVANKNILEHNKMVKNLVTEKKILISQTWRFIVTELTNDINNYNNEKNNIIKAIDNLNITLQKKNDEKKTKETHLMKLERQTVSIQPTLDGINKILVSFGFRSFSLVRGNDGKTYKLMRPDGSEAQDTLSDGERNFVTFLYFYYLLKGSHTESGITVDKIIVFDDPVSSLDSDVLFIVSTLIRELFDDVRNNHGTIKQIFVLTHNVYFHKEVSFDSRRNKNQSLKEESFWIIKKQGINSVIEKRESNPIKTSYELLWEEVRSKQHNSLTIRNTLRRILDNYFKLLGDIPLDELYTKMNGDKKIICRSLLSWLHDGSHNAISDEHYDSLSNEDVERYLEVFKQIFEQSNHIAHYNMMMRIDTEHMEVSNDVL